LLANIYLHYVFDLWVNQWRRKTAQGDVIVVRYADDAVLGFEHRSEAEAFLEQLRERMQKFGLELHPEKTRLIEFGRFAEEDRRRRGEGKPETFDFLGFTHSCGKTKKGNWFTIRRQTAKKRLRSKLQAVKQELGKRWHKRVVENGSGCGRWCRDTSTIMLFQETSRPCGPSRERWPVYGWRRSGVEANGIATPGSGSVRSWIATCLHRGFCIHYLAFASTPCTRGKSRMR
jgi:hypothetical protein